MFIVFDDMIPDIEANKKLNLIVTELAENTTFHLFLYQNLVLKCLNL